MTKRRGPLRAAGAAPLGDGRRLVWSVAEGRRGRRWRWAFLDGDRAEHAVLLELGPAGRPSRLEVASGSGLLTLHPEAEADAVHGNLVTANGVEHLALPWAAEAVFDLVDRFGPFVLATTVGERLPVGGAIEVATIGVDRFLRPAGGRARLTRLEATTFALEPSTPPGLRRGAWSGSLDSAGLPDLPGGRTWPLELD